MAGELLIDEPLDGVRRLTISNPDKRGALDHAILNSFTQTLPALQARCVIITGQGQTFSAGYDIGNLRGGGFADEAERLVANPFTTAIDAIEDYPYPTLGDVDSPQALADYQAAKRVHKAEWSKSRAASA